MDLNVIPWSEEHNCDNDSEKLLMNLNFKSITKRELSTLTTIVRSFFSKIILHRAANVKKNKDTLFSKIVKIQTHGHVKKLFLSSLNPPWSRRLKFSLYDKELAVWFFFHMKKVLYWNIGVGTQGFLSNFNTQYHKIKSFQ